jgi:germination protein YpeB
VDCYEFSLTANGYPLSAGVTRQGGKVLYILSDTDVTEETLPAQDLLRTAEAFLLSRGFGNMEMSYYSRSDGILTVNFAAVQDGTVLYPDLVKLQLSMKDGSVIGLESAHYLMNHIPRRLEAPLITEEEALSHLGEHLTAQSVRLCVVPVNANEALCYEIRATDGAGAFLAYIDAMTGAERELMQVISDEHGTLVM